MARAHTIFTTDEIRQLLGRFAAGDAVARDALFDRAGARMSVLAHRQLADFPAVARWAQSDDVAQGAAQRLQRALAELRPGTSREFFALCSQQIRRELLDLKRKYFGPEGPGAHHASPGPDTETNRRADAPPYQVSDTTHDPSKLARWTEFHGRIDALPDDLREVFDLVWYQELTHDDAAEVLGVSKKTVSRRWRDARLRLHDLLADGGV